MRDDQLLERRDSMGRGRHFGHPKIVGNEPMRVNRVSAAGENAVRDSARARYPKVAPVAKAVWSRREVRAIVALTVFAFALRLGWLLAAHPAAVSDALGYKSLAARWLHEGLYERGGQPTAWRTPGYITFLAGGLVVSDSDFWLSLLNVLAATTVIPLIAVFARRLGLSATVALIAAALAAVMPPMVLWSVVVGPENVQAPLLLAALILAADPRRSWRSAIWSGIAFGVAILVRPESIVYLPVVALVLVPAPWRAVGLRTVVVAAVALVLCAPWVVRNQIEVGSVGLSSVGGVNFYFAHRNNGYGYVPYQTTPLADLDEASMSKRGYKLGVENLRDDPGRLVGDIVEGTHRLYEPPRYAPWFSTRGFAKVAPYPRDVSARFYSVVQRVNVVGWYAIAGVAVAGWVLLVARRRRAALVITGFAVANWICFAVVFWALPRYRFPVEPLLCLSAAVAIDALIRILQRRARSDPARLYDAVDGGLRAEAR
jgi:4-amino-4-deoxy-L-arabinose transferase-like glycosyltransferase